MEQKLTTFGKKDVKNNTVFDRGFNYWRGRKNVVETKNNDKNAINNKIFEGLKTLVVWTRHAKRGNKQKYRVVI